MAVLNESITQKAVAEINEADERDRRALAKRRHELYKDGGKRFLIEQIEREFNRDAVKEMRIAPINVLKKIVNKRSVVYKNSPIRITQPENEDLVSFYVEELEFNSKMQKANRYYNLFSNTALYFIPSSGLMQFEVIPPFLYSVIPSKQNQTQAAAWLFSNFLEEGMVAPQRDVGSATGSEGFSRQRGYKTQQDLVASQEMSTDVTNRKYILWSDEQHATLDQNGSWMTRPGMDESQFLNPLGTAPIVNLAKDRDNEFWATQGEDAIDLSMAIALGWTDLLTIAKHQGFSLLTITSEEEPKTLTLGVNRSIWLRQSKDGPKPEIGYAQANSPLSEYKDLLMDLLGLLLQTNDMSPSSVGGAAKTFTSGFHAMIEMSDTLDAIEIDKPAMRDAELSSWEKVAAVHNWQHENGLLREDAMALGKFSEDFSVQVVYRDQKPIESEQEKISVIKELRLLGLVTRRDALKKLHPDLTEDQLEEKMQKIDEELSKVTDMFSEESDGNEESQV